MDHYFYFIERIKHKAKTKKIIYQTSSVFADVKMRQEHHNDEVL